jgi:hypothetical protein
MFTAPFRREATRALKEPEVGFGEVIFADANPVSGPESTFTLPRWRNRRPAAQLAMIELSASDWEKMIGDDLMLHSASGTTFDRGAVGEPGCGVVSDRISRRQDDTHIERTDSSVASSHSA